MVLLLLFNIVDVSLIELIFLVGIVDVSSMALLLFFGCAYFVD